MPLFIFSIGTSWTEFWRTDTITKGGGTINYITPPATGTLPFAVLLLIVAAVIFITILVIRRTDLTGRLIPRYIVYSFIVAGLLAALRMDYTWLAFFKDTIEKHYGKTLPERIVSVENFGLYTFIESVKKTIPEGGTVRHIDINRRADKTAYFFTILGNYYLLPVMTSRRGRFVWVYNFHTYNYNFGSKTLKVSNSTFKARVYALFGDGVLFELLDEG